MMEIKNDKHVNNARFFSPLSYFHRSHNELAIELLDELINDKNKGYVKIISDSTSKSVLAYRKLDWDTKYFGVPTYRVDFISTLEAKSSAIKGLSEVLKILTNELRSQHENFYIFGEFPSESIQAIQSLCLNGWRMVETRLSYFKELMGEYEYARRFPVRLAGKKDIDGLRKTAIYARNVFDRFHADHYYSDEVADSFLATFIENSINGFADITLVPHPDEKSPDAFLTANLLPANKALQNKRIGKMILSAVGESRRGWYVKLISEMSYLFKDKGIDIAFMTTQSTNRAVIRTWEKLGYSLGRSSHVFVLSQGCLNSL